MTTSAESRRWRWSHTGWLTLLLVDYLSWYAWPPAPMMLAFASLLAWGTIRAHSAQRQRDDALTQARDRIKRAKPASEAP
jgi:hypothetical protein